MSQGPWEACLPLLAALITGYTYRGQDQPLVEICSCNYHCRWSDEWEFPRVPWAYVGPVAGALSVAVGYLAWRGFVRAVAAAVPRGAWRPTFLPPSLGAAVKSTRSAKRREFRSLAAIFPVKRYLGACTCLAVSPLTSASTSLLSNGMPLLLRTCFNTPALG